MLLNAAASCPAHFAPPILELPGGQRLSQTANILNYLAPRLGLAGNQEPGYSDSEEAEILRARVNQVVLTVMDAAYEAHNVHHPIAVMYYYEDQKAESLRCADEFRKSRLPKWLNYMVAVLESNVKAGGQKGYIVGSNTTTADLAMFQLLEGLEFAFPKRMGKLREEKKYSAIWEFKERVAKEESIAKYLASDRRRAFGMGLFRHYPELDGEA
ncbi:hypothetical protein FRC02_011296 [Tulasnella sp. 418]|nr:hypothetical protein FRC02_011296 [Tulasnella sp. 418]